MNHFADLRSRLRRSDDERGAILVLTALVMLLLLFIAAFSTDLGAWYRQIEEQQRAADVGSLNGISAFDRASRDYFEANGISGFNQPGLDAADYLAAEDAGIQAAIATVQGLFESSGLTFSGPASILPGAILTPPATPTAAHDTVATLVADDGTVITITRTFVQNGIGLNGLPVFIRAIEVSVSADGEQFFSNILRDAPTIERSAQSLLSNCGAACDNPVEFNPPFQGFDASGRGDGFAPLPFDSDPTQVGFEEIWAVNHHSWGQAVQNFGDPNDRPGQIICLRTDSVPIGQECSGTPNVHFDLLYQTANRPLEHIAPDGKIYFAGRNPRPNAAGVQGETGLVCFDAATRNYCGTPFVPFWTQTWNPGPDTRVSVGTGGNFDGNNWTQHINVTGPIAVGDRLYIFSQSGQYACVNASTMNPCSPGGPFDLPGVAGVANYPGIDDTNPTVTQGELSADGSRLYLTQNLTDGNGVAVHCLNVGGDTLTSCGNPRILPLGTGGDDNLTFTRFETVAGQQRPTGICVLNVRLEQHGCVDTGMNDSSWGGVEQISGLNNGLNRLGQANGSWGGDTIEWEGRRTFFAGGNQDLVGCWNWETNSTCTDGVGSPHVENGGAYLSVDSAYTGTINANPYGFELISDRCILGLGHESIFYSFDPVGFGPCVDIQTTTEIQPCECSDPNAGVRWGSVTVPAEVIGNVTLLEATISTTADHENTGVAGLIDVDLLATGGVLDLTPLDDLGFTSAFLTIDVDSAITGGVLAFDEQVIVDLEISVLPTLAE